MVRPTKGALPLDQRLQLMLTTDDIAAVDDWMFANRVRTRSEAIRQLIERGLIGLRPTEVGDTIETLEHLAHRLSGVEGDLAKASKRIEEVGRKLTGKEKERLIEANSIVDEAAEALRTQKVIVYQLAPEPEPTTEPARKGRKQR